MGGRGVERGGTLKTNARRWREGREAVEQKGEQMKEREGAMKADVERGRRHG
jgi:hypothetical protein